MTASTVTRLVFAFACLLAASTVGAQEKLDTKAKLLAGAKTVMDGMCADHREYAKLATSIVMIRLADKSVSLWCSCAPAEMQRLVAGVSEPISRETALNTFNQATSICHGKQMRESTNAACPTDQEALARSANINAYCTCVKTRLAALTDEQLYRELDAAYNNEMQESTTSGKTVPGLESFALRKFGTGCESAAVSLQ